MKILFILFILIGCQTQKLKDVTRLRSFGILQGPTTENKTILSVALPVDMDVDYKFYEERTKLANEIKIKLSSKKFKDSSWRVDHIKLSELKPGILYTLIVKDQQGKVLDERTFSSFKGKATELNFMLASCLTDTYDELARKIWPQVFTHKPEVIFLIGDVVYADIYNGIYLGRPAPPDHLWERFMDARNTVPLYKIDHLVPVYAIWDDHDFGVNDGDSTYAYKNESLINFNVFFPVLKSKQLESGPGLSHVLRVAGQEFYFLDNRYFRSPSKKGAHFGDEQLKWFFENVSKSDEPMWIISGDQFFGAYHPYESLEGSHPKEFKTFMEQLKKVKRNFIFASGDRHLVEIMQIPKAEVGLDTYELTSSGIHSKVFEGSLERNPNPRRIDGKDGVENFMMIKSENREGALKVEARSFDSHNNELVNFSKMISR
jgi:alkaline phosphatase D